MGKNLVGVTRQVGYGGIRIRQFSLGIGHGLTESRPIKGKMNLFIWRKNLAQLCGERFRAGYFQLPLYLDCTRLRLYRVER